MTIVSQGRVYGPLGAPLGPLQWGPPLNGGGGAPSLEIGITLGTDQSLEWHYH